MFALESFTFKSSCFEKIPLAFTLTIAFKSNRYENYKIVIDLFGYYLLCTGFKILYSFDSNLRGKLFSFLQKLFKI